MNNKSLIAVLFVGSVVFFVLGLQLFNGTTPLARAIAIIIGAVCGVLALVVLCDALSRRFK